MALRTRLLQRWPELEAFVLGSDLSLAGRDLGARRPLGFPLRILSSDQPAGVRFAQRFQRLNAFVFGELALPGWVLLDLGLLPSFFVGLGGPARHLDAPVRRALQLDDDDEFVPWSVFGAAPSFTPDTVVGWSLTSVLRGAGLGVLAKALGLACYGARRQIGITQLDNASLRVHTRLGSLRIVRAGVPLHTRAGATFVYALDVPDEAGLLAAVAQPPVAGPVDRRIAASDVASIQALDAEVQAGAAWAVVWPGLEGGTACLRRISG